MTKLLYKSSIILFMALFFTSCIKNSMESDVWSIALDCVNPVIYNKKNDIGFKFCLLNKDSIPSNTFKENERFYFFFSIINLSKGSVMIDEANLFCDDFCMVYQNETQIGKPWYTKFCEYRAILNNLEIHNEPPYEVILPWRYIPQYDAGTGRIKRGFFCIQNPENENSNAFLSKGIYICRFNMDFIYKKNGKEIKIKDLFFEINFKIE